MLFVVSQFFRHVLRVGMIVMKLVLSCGGSHLRVGRGAMTR